MSNTTSIILITSILEEKSKINSIDEYLIAQDHKPLGHKIDKGGGEKGIGCNVYWGGFNYLDIPAFVKEIYSIQWLLPGEMQLLIKMEQDPIFIDFVTLISYQKQKNHPCTNCTCPKCVDPDLRESICSVSK